MRLLHLIVIITFLVSCHGAVLPGAEDLNGLMDVLINFAETPDDFVEALGGRTKRQVDLAGFRVFDIPSLGVEMKFKRNSFSNMTGIYRDLDGGEAHLYIQDLQSLVPHAMIKMVRLKVKFDLNGLLPLRLALFNIKLDYQLEHMLPHDHNLRHGLEAGSFKATRLPRAQGVWKFHVKSETAPLHNCTSSPQGPGRGPIFRACRNDYRTGQYDQFDGRNGTDQYDEAELPFTPFIPETLSNVEFEVETSDAGIGRGAETSFKGKFVNSETGRDVRWLASMTTEGGKFTLTVLPVPVRFRPPFLGRTFYLGEVQSVHHVEVSVGKVDNVRDMRLDIKASTSVGHHYDGKILYQPQGSGQDQRSKFLVQLRDLGDRGSYYTVLKLAGRVEGPAMAWKQISLILLRPSWLLGLRLFKIRRESGMFTAEVANYKLAVSTGNPYKIEVFEYETRGRDQRIPAWSYQFDKEVAANAGSYELTLTSAMTSDRSSRLIRYHIPHVIRDLLDNNGTTKFHIFVDKNNKNFLLPKFKVDFEAAKNGEQVLTIKRNTLTNPHTLTVSAPALLEVLGIESPFTLTTSHKMDISQKSLVIETGLAGGASLLNLTINWEKPWDSYLSNLVHVKLDGGAENNIASSLNWKLPDMGESNFEMVVTGKSSLLNCDIEQKVKLTMVDSKTLALDWNGDSTFTSGTLAPYSPIKTEAEVTTMDLGAMGLQMVGKMAITLAGKEYSVEFKPGEEKPIVKIGA